MPYAKLASAGSFAHRIFGFSREGNRTGQTSMCKESLRGGKRVFVIFSKRQRGGERLFEIFSHFVLKRAHGLGMTSITVVVLDLPSVAPPSLVHKPRARSEPIDNPSIVKNYDSLSSVKWPLASS